MEPHWTLGASWSVESPKLVIICPKDYLPSIPNILAAACSSLYLQQGLWHVLNLVGLWNNTKEQPVSTQQSLSHIFPGACLGAACQLHTCSSSPSHMAHWAVSPLTRGSHAPVFFCQASKCGFGMSQISPSDVCSETPSWVTGGNCTSGAGGDGPLWLTEVVSSHTCVLHTQAKRIQNTY